jgi:hypothetical protein
VEQSIRDLQAPLSLARSRLVIRANKASVEVRPDHSILRSTLSLVPQESFANEQNRSLRVFDEPAVYP